MITGTIRNILIDRLPKFLFFLTIFYSRLINGQTNQSDTTHTGFIKNFAWGVTPVLSYDADIGFKYGANINLFDYKESGSTEYSQYLHIKLVNSTRHTMELMALLDSDRVIKNAKLIVESSYMADKNIGFFGFNGINAVYNKEFVDPDNPEYINRLYYTYERKLYRARIDLQHQLCITPLRLYTGIALNSYKISPVNFDNYNIPDGPDNKPAQNRSLYTDYIDWAVINANEQNGGLINYFTLGLIYDTRNDQRVTTKGIWIEAYELVSPGGISDQAFSKFILTFRQYFDIKKANMVFSYRLSSQLKTSGNIPFDMLPTYYGSQINRDGLGGVYNLKGVPRNRVAADGFLIGNFELRKKIVSFRLFKLDFDILGSTFSDVAIITQIYEFDDSEVPDVWKEQLFNNKDQSVFATYGLGLYVIYNENNIMSIYYGASKNEQLGRNGLYMRASFLF